jgi:telomerase reverse transcriptase
VVQASVCISRVWHDPGADPSLYQHVLVLGDVLQKIVSFGTRVKQLQTGIIQECERASLLPVQSREVASLAHQHHPIHAILNSATTRATGLEATTTARPCTQVDMKRKRSSHGGGGIQKKARHFVDQSANATPSAATHPVLQRLYAQVSTLRHYLLSRLPSASTTRRRRISQLGHATAAQDTNPKYDIDIDVAQLLDSALVGTLVNLRVDKPVLVDEGRDQDIEAFTQQRSHCTPGGTFKPGYFMQTEVGRDTQAAPLRSRLIGSHPEMAAKYIQVVDFVIWRLFKRSASPKPTHLLCHGFQRAGKARLEPDVNHDSTSSIPGLVERQLNGYTRTLKEPVWCRLHALLGQGGDRIMMDMLLECSIFLPIKASTGNYYQLSGAPVSELRVNEHQKSDTAKIDANPEAPSKSSHLRSENRAPGAITFVRSRMLYAKAALNAKGGVRFGMHHIR